MNYVHSTNTQLRRRCKSRVTASAKLSDTLLQTTHQWHVTPDSTSTWWFVSRNAYEYRAAKHTDRDQAEEKNNQCIDSTWLTSQHHGLPTRLHVTGVGTGMTCQQQCQRPIGVRGRPTRSRLVHHRALSQRSKVYNVDAPSQSTSKPWVATRCRDS